MEIVANDALTVELLKAIKNHEFVLFYQPQYDLFTTKFEGVEALIRWRHPTRGLLLPHEFIPVAEESDLIVQMGEWVLITACQQVRAWLTKGFPFIRMAVNVSKRQLQHKNFVATVISILRDFELDPTYLELELTEKIIIQHSDKEILERIRQLHELGVQIALDDFGTGYTSISSLKNLPIDRIKIDKTFIDNIYIKSEDAAIVRAIITLATTLNLKVTAEGVETLNQLQTLTQKQSIGIQGFYLSEALPVEELEKFLQLYQNR